MSRSDEKPDKGRDEEQARLVERARPIGEQLMASLGCANPAELARLLVKRAGLTGVAGSSMRSYLGFGGEMRLSVPSREEHRQALLALVEEELGRDARVGLESCWKERRALDERRRVAPRSPSAPRTSSQTALQHRRSDLEAFCRVSPLVDLDIRATFGLGSHLVAGDGLPPYVEREADASLDERLRAALAAGPDDPHGRLVVVAGPPKSGKTRSALERLRSVAAEAGEDSAGEIDVLLPRPWLPNFADAFSAYRAELARTPRQGSARDKRAHDARPVVLLDDYQDRLQGGERDQPHLALLERLLAQPGAPVVLVTIHEALLELESQSATKQLFDPELLEHLDRRAGARYRSRLTGPEELAAAEAFAGAGIELDESRLAGLSHLAELCAAVPALRAKFDEGAHSGDRELRWFAIALRDLAVVSPAGASKEAVRALADAHLDVEAHNYHPLADAAFERCFDWAREPKGAVWAVLNKTDDGHWKVLDGLVEHLTDGHELDPCIDDVLDPVRCFNAGVYEYEGGRHHRAKGLYRRAAYAGIGEAWFNLASVLFREGRRRDAVRAFEKAAKAGVSEAWNNLGGLLAVEGRPRDAERAYKNAIKAGVGAAWNNLGNLLRDEGRPSEAEHAYRQAIEAGINGSWRNLGKLLVNEARPEQAERAYWKAIESGDTESWVGLGDLLAKQHRPDEAKAAYEAAIAAGDREAWNNFGNLLAAQGQRAKAESAYSEAGEAGCVVAWLNLGNLLVDEDKMDEAKRAYEKAVEAGDERGWFYLGNLLVDEDKMDEAKRAYEKAVEAGDERGWFYLGNLVFEEGRPEDAEHAFWKAIEAGDTRAWLNLGALLASDGRSVEAEEAFRKAIEAGHTDAWRALGGLLVSVDREEEAKQAFEQAVEAGGSTVSLSLGFLRLVEDRLDEARQAFEQAAADAVPGAREMLDQLDQLDDEDPPDDQPDDQPDDDQPADAIPPEHP